MSGRPRRLLLLDQFGTLGGGQRMLCGMVQRGVELGWKVGVAIPQGPLRELVSGLGAVVYPLDVPVVDDERKGISDVIATLLGAQRIRAQFRQARDQFRPDLVHVNGARALVAAAGGSGSTPLTLHAHTLQSSVSARLTRTLLRWAAARRVIAPSEFMALWAQRTYALDLAEVVVVENWVDLIFWSSVGDSRGHERAETRPLTFGMVGRVVAIKGQADALRAIIAARAGGADVRLVVAGSLDTDYARQLARIAERDPGALELLGRVEDIVGVLATFDVVLVTSVQAEAFGLAAAEAMAVGIPVIAYASGALPDVVGDAGILVPTGDVEGLAQEVMMLARDPERRVSLVRAGRTRVAERFDYATQTDKLFAVFESLVSEARA